jgi:hypothetical protein
MVRHISGVCVFAAVVALACRELFLLPLWLGGVLGIVIYTGIFLEVRFSDRVD